MFHLQSSCTYVRMEVMNLNYCPNIWLLFLTFRPCFQNQNLVITCVHHHKPKLPANDALIKTQFLDLDSKTFCLYSGLASTGLEINQIKFKCLTTLVLVVPILTNNSFKKRTSYTSMCSLSVLPHPPFYHRVSFILFIKIVICVDS